MLISNFIKQIINLDLTNKKHKKIKIKKPRNILDDNKSKLGIKLNLFIIFLIIVSISAIIFESIGDNKIIYSNQLFILDGFISTIFALEYFYRLYKSKNKIKHSLKIMNIVDLLAFLPFFLGLLFEGLINLSILKALRILRIFRIFKLLRQFKSINYILIGLKNFKSEYQIGFILVTIILLLSSIIMYHIESGVNPGFKSIPDTMRWAIVTTATVGYGDTYPITTLGKIVGSIIILIGPMFIAMISSITVLVFFEVAHKNKLDREHNKEACPRCNSKENPYDANYCKICGEKLFHKTKKIKPLV